VEDRPDPRIDKIPVKGVMGAVLGIGLMVGLMLELPVLRWFLLISAALGVAIGGGLYWWHKRRPITEVEEDSIKLNLK